MEGITTAAWQAILSRGDQQTGRLLLSLAAADADRRPSWRRLVKENLPLLAARPPGEPLPWSFRQYPVPPERLLAIYDKIRENCLS